MKKLSFGLPLLLGIFGFGIQLLFYWISLKYSALQQDCDNFFLNVVLALLGLKFETSHHSSFTKPQKGFTESYWVLPSFLKFSSVFMGK